MGEVQEGVLQLGQLDKHEVINPLDGKTKAIDVKCKAARLSLGISNPILLIFSTQSKFLGTTLENPIADWFDTEKYYLGFHLQIKKIGHNVHDQSFA